MTSTTMSITTARCIRQARHHKALRLARVAAAHLRKVGGQADDLASLGEDGWEVLASLAGTRIPSVTTRELTIAYVRRYHRGLGGP